MCIYRSWELITPHMVNTSLELIVANNLDNSANKEKHFRDLLEF